ncbi:hypothetical protein BSL78_03218 [Apostichopus japonicus]|uniref:Alpha-2-macroglobulin bait region domain-containing protein n=1 Tax=Stichopus japonicus TaxID=307972 RepID=A0A2G8LHW8_STIJA|nr:hypothetical protein BSL78_03218 [Apostichopus japonicus]
MESVFKGHSTGNFAEPLGLMAFPPSVITRSDVCHEHSSLSSDLKIQSDRFHVLVTAAPVHSPPPAATSRHDLWIIARGNIVSTGTTLGLTQIAFQLTQEMTPHARLIAYYVREDGEVVLDVIEFPVEGAITHQVGIDFVGRTEASPGDTVTLSVTADAGAFIGLLGIDRSVSLFRDGNDITRGDVSGLITDKKESTG